MGLPFWMGVFGVVVSVAYLIHAAVELRKNTPGHSRNAAMIHVGMASMFLPASLIIIALSL